MSFQEIIKNIKIIDKNILKIVKNGLKFSIVFCLIAIYILTIYTVLGAPHTYYIGMSLLKSGLFYIVGFIICGIAFNKIIGEIKK